jgi:mRNA-degrading endonuclease toxin of MazEF toxin-antitoxin module
MQSSPSPLVRFYEVLHSVASLPEAQQMAVFQRELRDAFEREARLQRQCVALGRDLIRARTRAIVGAHRTYVRRADLGHELSRARRDLARTKVEAEEEIQALRVEVLRVEHRYRSLDEVCRALLLTIEQAACGEASACPCHRSEDLPSKRNLS